MNVFVSEYLCSGACEVSLADASLLTEGAAMLDAVVIDLLAISGCTVTVCVRESLPAVSRIFQQAEHAQRLQVIRVSEPKEEQALFDRACQQADVVWVIAPEFDELLVSRTERALQAGAHVIGPDLNTIQLTADKWRLFEYLNKRDLPTIPTLLLKDDSAVAAASFPCLIKHRSGAGGLGLQYLSGIEEWQKRRSEYQQQRSYIKKKTYHPGKSLSTVVLADAKRREIFPIGEQRISWELGFAYQGGMIPAELDRKLKLAIHELISRACDLLPGLVGVVGFDILVPDSDPGTPLMVEINPRLTTSYVGYRQLTPDNLAERIVKGSAGQPALRWHSESCVQFQPDGSVCLNQSQL